MCVCILFFVLCKSEGCSVQYDTQKKNLVLFSEDKIKNTKQLDEGNTGKQLTEEFEVGK